MKFLWCLFNEISLISSTSKLPVGSLKEVSIDVGTFCGACREVINIEGVLHISLQDNIVEWKSMLTSSDLHDGRQVGHWVEESRDPNNWWGLCLISPLPELIHSQDQILEPILKHLQGWISNKSPR